MRGIKNPRFKTCFHVEVMHPDQVLLFNEKGNRILLAGAPYVLLAPYLQKNGSPLNQILDALKHKLPLPEIYYALFRMQEKQLLEEGVDLLPQALSAFCNLLDVPIERAARNLKKMTVSLHGVGDLSPKNFTEKLKEFLFTTVSDGKLSVVLTENYRCDELETFNTRALKSRKPWMLVKPVGAEIWMGPIFIPGKTACYTCLLEALNRAALHERFVEKRKKRETPLQIHLADLPTSESLAIGLAANEIFKWTVRGGNDAIEGKILSYTPLSLKIESHHITRRPHCPSCGTPPPKTPQPLLLESQKKRFVEDGGHRICHPEETYKKYQQLISPITGIVDSLQPSIPNGPACMPSYKAGYKEGEVHYANRLSPNSVSAGKGKTHEQAKTSCLCEAIERYSGLFFGDEIREKGSYIQLRKEAIHPNAILLFSENQYKIRKRWNQSCHKFHYIPFRFDEKGEIDWSPVWSMTEKKFKWIPTAICYRGQSFSKFFLGDTNGCASGNTKEEAILQGFFELVERDSLALWWYSRILRPGVNLASFGDPYILTLKEYYASCSREIWALDLTMDLQIPTFAAFSRNVKKEKEQILFGFGSHFDPKIALMRALTEMNQSFPLLNADATSFLDPDFRIVGEWINSATIGKHPYLYPSSQIPQKNFSDYTSLSSDDLKEDVLLCQKIVEEKGMEMLVLDQTRPDIGLSVVKVFVPGLRHMWNRYAPGRLYDIPFQLGLIERKLKEDELNPLPIFL